MFTSLNIWQGGKFQWFQKEINQEKQLATIICSNLQWGFIFTKLWKLIHYENTHYNGSLIKANEKVSDLGRDQGREKFGKACTTSWQNTYFTEFPWLGVLYQVSLEFQWRVFVSPPLGNSHNTKYVYLSKERE